MKVEFIEEFDTKEFTFKKVYDCQDTYDGLMVIDDTGTEHIIARKDNPYNSYYEDDFFRYKFKVL